MSRAKQYPKVVSGPLGRVGKHINWESGDQPVVKHNDIIHINYTEGLLGGEIFVMPDSEPVGTTFHVVDTEEYSGHTGGMNFSTALTFQNPYALPFLTSSVPTSLNHHGAPPNKDHSLRFEKKIDADTEDEYWEVSYGMIPPDTSSGEETVRFPNTELIGFVRHWGRDARDEGTNFDPAHPQGWMPQIGNRNAPFYSVQDAYDNGVRFFNVGKNAGSWTPGNLKCQGTGETIVFFSEYSTAIIGNISVEAHTANVTSDPNYGATTWEAPESPVLTIKSLGSNILFGNISVYGGAGSDGVNAGENGNTGFNATLTLQGLVANTGATVTVNGGPGGNGLDGNSGDESNPGQNGGNGGTGGAAIFNCSNCAGFAYSIAGGSGGGPGLGGGDGGAGPGSDGTAGSVGTTTVNHLQVATEAEARAGSINYKLMTPLRVAQAIDELAGSIDLSGYATVESLGAYALISSLAGYQPLDSDLTAIAALTTTSTGRALLTEALAQLGSGALVRGTSPSITTPVLIGISVVRQSGGTAGTDEIQISHDGTRGYIDCKDGTLRVTVGSLVNSNTFEIKSVAGGVPEIGSSGSNKLIGNIVVGPGASGSGWQVDNQLRWVPASSGSYTIASTPISPAQLTGNVNNYNPSGNGRFYRLSSDASRNITGFAFTSVVTGQEFQLVNVGSFNIVLQHENASSTAANRLICTGGADITLTPNEEAICWYDGTTQRYRVRKV